MHEIVETFIIATEEMKYHTLSVWSAARIHVCHVINDWILSKPNTQKDHMETEENSSFNT